MLQAIESAVAAAVLDHTEQVVYQKKESEALQAAQQAAADTQALRELEDRCEALQSQLAATTDSLHSSDNQLRYGCRHSAFGQSPFVQSACCCTCCGNVVSETPKRPIILDSTIAHD